MFNLKELIGIIGALIVAIICIWWGVFTEHNRWDMIKENNKMLHELILRGK